MRRGNGIKVLAIGLMLALIFITTILVQSISPVTKAKKQAKAVANSIAGVERVDDFYWFIREKTYFTIIGRDGNNESKIVLIPEDGSEAVVMNASEGLTEKEAIVKVLETKEVKRVKKINLGMVKGEPVWEVTAVGNSDPLSYYLVDFKSGDIIETIHY